AAERQRLGAPWPAAKRRERPAPDCGLVDAGGRCWNRRRGLARRAWPLMAGRTIERRAARVSLVNALSTALQLVFQFISVPVCLKYWGKESYGGWLALFSAFLLLRGLDGGFISYVGNKLNYLYHKDTAALRRHLSSAISGILVIGGIQILIAGSSLLIPAVA